VTAGPAPVFAIGDRVVIKRNLDHPAWMKQVPADPRNGGTRWVRDPEISEEIGEGEILSREARLHSTELRVTNGFFYDAATGLQVHSGATFIRPLATEG